MHSTVVKMHVHSIALVCFGEECLQQCYGYIFFISAHKNVGFSSTKELVSTRREFFLKRH